MGLYAKGVAVDIAAISKEMQPVVEGWQNATIQVIDPNIADGTYNKWKNEVTGKSHAVLWSGRARIQPLRWPLMVTGSAEQASYRAVRFQIPLGSSFTGDMLVREGLRIRVKDGGQFKDLERGMFVITAGSNSSFAWNRTFEAQMDQGIDLGGS